MSKIADAFKQVEKVAGRVKPEESAAPKWDYADEAFRIIRKFKPMMEKRGLRQATCHCKFCGGKDTIVMQLGRFKHRGNYPFHFSCTGCKFYMLT